MERSIRISFDPSKVDVSEWSNFVSQHPLGNIYQTPEMFKVYSNTKSYSPTVISAFNSQEELIGLLLGVIIREKSRLTSTFSARNLVFGGPITKSNDLDLIRRMLIEYFQRIKKQAIYTEIRETFELPFQSFQSSLFTEAEDRLNIIVDLTKSEDELWSEVNTKRKNEIRRAIKEGTTVRELNSSKEIEESYLILKEVYARAKLPIAPKELFINSFEYLYPKKMIKYYGAYNAGKLIGTMYILCYGDRAIDWYAGSFREYYNKYPNDLIPWEVFKALKQEGFKVFDFGGAGTPGIAYGVRDYKRKFGGELIIYNRYRKVHKPTLMKLAKQGFKLWQIFSFTSK